jgi:methylmalonyl-CoA mutase C-terminal domain/subunit
MKKRILLAKMGLDCHDTGIVTVAYLLRDAGYEVIYLGLHNFAEKVVKVAMEEDVDAIGISFLSGQHMTQMRLLLEQLHRDGMQVPVFCGGVIPDDDAAELKAMGVAEVVLPGTLSAEVARRVNNILVQAAA